MMSCLQLFILQCRALSVGYLRELSVKLIYKYHGGCRVFLVKFGSQIYSGGGSLRIEVLRW